MKTPRTSRRGFLGHAGMAIGAATLATRTSGAAPGTQPAPFVKPKPTTAASISMGGVKATGWNVYATRFVYAPTISWEPVDGAVAYVVQVAGEKDASAKTIRLDKPLYHVTNDWAALDVGPVDVLVSAVDAKDRALCPAMHRHFSKSPGFDGQKQEPLDWNASIDRVMTYMLAPARDEVQEYERGLPRSCWAACEDSITGKRRFLAFPALHHPSFILAYLDYGRDFPDSKLTPEAIKQATQYADWLLANRSPADWRCSLFPFSTIQNGKTEGYIEGRNITLFRSARVGEAMVAMFEQSKDEKYLAYAKHLANVYVELQRPDGSWPYRVDPKDGKVVEDYTSNAVTPARLLGMLEAIEPNAKYTACREKAAKWVMENPVQNRRWQGMYEDVGLSDPYRNLQHWDTNEMIRYLVHFERQNAETMRIAEGLNQYIEDQFVVWQPGDRFLWEHCPTPTVLEQYRCYKAMESHTGMWIQSLIALHRTTGNDEYMSKAIAAGNSVVRAQQESGAYSTWGFDTRFGRPLLTLDWPGCNAVAALGILRLGKYMKGLPKSREETQAL